jgi:cysteine sulfinate desulfinase/cysteine desulfurase-like protein
VQLKLLERNKMPKGLYANIQAKRKRIKGGSNERMRKVGSKGAPSAAAFKKAARTAKKK